MRGAGPDIVRTIDELEAFHGPQAPRWPTDPYEFLIWWHCGYPASEANCAKGWEALGRQVALEPRAILDAGAGRLARALQSGGMVPELRAQRLIEIAARVQDEFGGDLRAALAGPLPDVRKKLKKFPGISDPGADRILLFGGLAPVAAVPSNCPHVLVRLVRGREHENYGTTYREAQEAIEGSVPKTFDARKRVFLVVQQHGQSLCKRTNPKCVECPVQGQCAFFQGKYRGRPAPA